MKMIRIAQKTEISINLDGLLSATLIALLGLLILSLGALGLTCSLTFLRGKLVLDIAPQVHQSGGKLTVIGLGINLVDLFDKALKLISLNGFAARLTD